MVAPCCSSSNANDRNQEKQSGRTNSFRLLRRRCVAKQESDAGRTIQLDSDFDLFGSESDGNDRDQQGCLKIRTHAESLQSHIACSAVHKESKSVCFGELEIHSHGIILGDNPSVSSGPPLTIRWKAFDSQKITLDEYEEHKPPSRAKDAMLLPRMVREDWLRKNGYARSEIRETVSLMDTIKNQRFESARDGLWKLKIKRLIGI